MRRFRVLLALVTAAGLAVRLIAVAEATRTLGFTDGLFFHLQANFLATGSGFVNSGRLAYTFVAEPSAQHPPLFALLLAGVSRAGGTSVLAHQLTCAVVSATAVPIIGLTAREIGGSRAGLAAAAIAAVYPNLWASDAAVMSESLYVAVIALVLLTSCRLWKRPTYARAVGAGLAIGAAALVRQEAILLLPLAIVPQLLRSRVEGRRMPARRSAALVGACVLAAVAVTAPWVIRNLTTFDRPVFLADNGDVVIGGANCPATYYGRATGSWDSACADITGIRGDESVVAAEVRARGFRYARDHLTRVPVVAAARIGRAWDLFRPFQGAGDGRSRWMRTFGVLTFWMVVPVAALGAVVGRRRSMSLLPFAGQAVVVTLVAASGYGLWRLRLPVDVAAIALGGAAFTHGRGQLRAGWRVPRCP